MLTVVSDSPTMLGVGGVPGARGAVRTDVMAEYGPLPPLTVAKISMLNTATSEK